MGLQEDLLARGWLPRELPPPFGTATFAHAVASTTTIGKEWFDAQPVAELGFHNLPRYAALRRTVTLVNPTAQYGLCNEVAASWPELQRVFDGSKVSVSSPVSAPAGRALDRRLTRVELPQRRALNRVGARWVLRTDLARCYGSMYTHSVPWALHSKAVAKANRTTALAGNRIDTWIRKGQAGQTIGIPVGPDTSLAVAEAILSAIDSEFSKVTSVRTLRYMDDYECATSSEAEATDALGALQDALRPYELAINGEKTFIEQLPRELQRPWTARLRSRDIRSGTPREAIDLVDYFDEAFELVRRFPLEPVLNYALAHLRTMPPLTNPGARRTMEALLLQAMLLEPGTHRYVINYLTEKPENKPVAIDEVRAVLGSQIARCAQLRHTNEVAWALWASIALSVKLETSVGAQVSKIDDDVVALLALHARQAGLLDGVDVTLWSSFMVEEQLRGEHWLLAYEATTKRWLPSKNGTDYVGSDACFRWMRDNGVSFYDTATPLTVPDEMLEPEAAWEDSYS